MKIVITCIFDNEELRKIWEEIGSVRDVNEFVGFLNQKKLNLLTMSELGGIIDYINKTVNLQFKIRKCSQKVSMVRRIESILFQKIDSEGGESLEKALNNTTRISSSTRRSSFEENMCDRVAFDLKLNSHHFLFHKIHTLKDVVLVRDNQKVIRLGTLEFNESELERIRSGELEFHIYCLRYRISNNENISNVRIFIPQNFSSIGDCVTVNSHENVDNFTPPNRPFQPPNDPKVLNPNILEEKNTIVINLKQNETFTRNKLVLYFSIVHKQKKFPDEVMNLLIHQTEEVKTNLEFAQQTKKRRLKSERDEDEDDDDDEEEKERGLCRERAVVVDIRDPLLLDRIEIPVKSSSCRHHQSFDLKTALEWQIDSRVSETTTFQCPHCYREFLLHDLMVDTRMMRFLKCLPPPEFQDIDKIQIVGTRDQEIIPIFADGRVGKKIIVDEGIRKWSSRRRRSRVITQFEDLRYGDSDDEEEEEEEESDVRPPSPSVSFDEESDDDNKVEDDDDEFEELEMVEKKKKRKIKTEDTKNNEYVPPPPNIPCPPQLLKKQQKREKKRKRRRKRKRKKEKKKFKQIVTSLTSNPKEFDEGMEMMKLIVSFFREEDNRGIATSEIAARFRPYLKDSEKKFLFRKILKSVAMMHADKKWYLKDEFKKL